MRRMQLVAPELKAIQEKYKDDQERQQREMMALYKTHGVNPLASCFPFILQIPFFIAVYSLLRCLDLQRRRDQQRGEPELPLRAVDHRGARGRREVGPDRPLHRHHGAQLHLHDGDHADDERCPALHACSPFRSSSRRSIASQPAGLAVYWITTNVWSLGQQMVVQRLIPAPPPPTPEEVVAAKPPPPPPRKKKKRR